MTWQGVEKIRINALEGCSLSTSCIKTGFLPESSLPLGETREREQAVKILFQQPARNFDCGNPQRAW